jgi:O-antigen biosynthesis protein
MSVLVVIPVYNGLESTLRCLASVRAHAPSLHASHRLLIVHDASPDQNVAAALNAFSLSVAGDRATKMRAVEVRHNAVNRGFTANVNQAFAALRAHEHLLLLNSDTLVTHGWLDEMIRTAESDSRIGTVTAFSNNATICSFPDFQREWPVPDAQARERIAQQLAADRVDAIDIPTGVGFCMLMTRPCIDAVGRFDIENFPRGYGEENDFCMRAAAAQFRNVLCPNAYVAHEGGVSFSDARIELMRAGGERLLAKHPAYNALVADWIGRDPARARRDAIAARLAR